MKNKYGNVEEKYREMIIGALQYHFPGAKMYLFGSRARGTNKEGADIDMAVDTGKEIDVKEMWRARMTLEHLFVPLNIDLVDMRSISKDLRDLILEEGIEWPKKK